jgi:hypothetical protein
VEAGRRDLVIRLDEPGGIDVHLVDFPPGAEVLATRGSRTGGPARSLLQGDVHRVRGLVPGDYLVIAQAGGHAASQRVTVSPGAIAEVTLKSPGTTEISVRVTEFPGGAPIPGMTCKIAPVVDEEFGRIDAVREGKTDGAGRLTVTGPAGEVVVACGKRGKEWLSNPITGQGHVEVRAVAFMPPPYEAFFGVMLSMDSVLTAVVPGSPAERAGLRTGDEVVAIDGAETRGEGWLVNLFLHTRTPGTLVRFGLSRGGSRLELPVTAGSRDD